MRKTYAIFVCLLLTTIAYSQKEVSQTIKGTVIDEQSKYPIIGATVQLLIETKLIGTTTDIDGKFILEDVPVGRNILKVTYIGYKEAILSNILVLSGKETVLQIKIEEQVTALDEVVVYANKGSKEAINGMASGSVRVLSIEELSRFSGGFGDPARMSQNYAGVSGATDNRNDIIVRGNSPSNVLWRMEGIDIPSPNHWSILGTTGGPVGMLNANNLNDFDFLSGAFPAEYGNATAAVFDLNLRNGNADKYEFLGQIGFNGFEFGAEGPLPVGKDASFIANYRYSTLGVFDALGINFGTGSAIPKYQDGVFKINVPTEKAGRFSFWGLGGLSNISFEDSGSNIYTDASGKIDSGSKTGILGFSHLYFFNSNTFSKLSLSFAASNSLNTASSVKDTIDLILEDDFISDYRQNKYGINWTINKKINAKNRLKAGLIFDIYDLQVIDSIRLTNDTWFSETNFKGTASLIRLFAQWQHRFSDQLSMNVGLHSARFLLNDTQSLEPRFGLNYKLNNKHNFSLGISRHNQLQPLPIYFSKDETASAAENSLNEALKFIRSDHFILGWNYAITPSFSIKIEAYHQRLDNLAIEQESSSFSMINAGAEFSFPNIVGLVNEGTGTNTGIELTFEKSLSKGFYGLFTTSLFDSQYKASDGLNRNTVFNSNYVMNLLAGKEFKFSDNWILALDAKFTIAGGRRYTPINLNASIEAGRTIRDATQVFEAQYKPYIRPDIKISMRNNQPKYSQIWAIDFTNFINRRNEFRKYYNANTESIWTSYQRGFFPNVLYQIVF